MEGEYRLANPKKRSDRSRPSIEADDHSVRYSGCGIGFYKQVIHTEGEYRPANPKKCSVRSRLFIEA